jgi:hypothetical protein
MPLTCSHATLTSASPRVGLCSCVRSSTFMRVAVANTRENSGPQSEGLRVVDGLGDRQSITIRDMIMAAGH